MTIVEDLIDDIEGMNKYEFMVLRYLAGKGQAYKTAIMQDIIREFPDDMEHGEYLIPGKEFSDDLDQAMESMRYCGQISTINGRLALSDYGRNLYETIMAHPEIGIDADLAEFIERLEADENDRGRAPPAMGGPRGAPVDFMVAERRGIPPLQQGLHPVPVPQGSTGPQGHPRCGHRGPGP